jgi:hypothetical protein
MSLKMKMQKNTKTVFDTFITTAHISITIIFVCCTDPSKSFVNEGKSGKK